MSLTEIRTLRAELRGQDAQIIRLQNEIYVLKKAVNHVLESDASEQEWSADILLNALKYDDTPDPRDAALNKASEALCSVMNFYCATIDAKTYDQVEQALAEIEKVGK